MRCECRGGALFFEHQVGRKAVVYHVARAQLQRNPGRCGFCGVAVAAEGDHVRIGFGECLRNALASVGGETVVCVQKADVSAARGVDAGIAGRRKPTVGLVYDDDTRVLALALCQNVARSIRAPVIHAYHFDVRECLRLQRIKTGVQVVFYVVYRDDYRKGRVLGCVACAGNGGRSRCCGIETAGHATSPPCSSAAWQ